MAGYTWPRSLGILQNTCNPLNANVMELKCNTRLFSCHNIAGKSFSSIFSSVVGK